MTSTSYSQRMRVFSSILESHSLAVLSRPNFCLSVHYKAFFISPSSSDMFLRGGGIGYSAGLFQRRHATVPLHNRAYLLPPRASLPVPGGSNCLRNRDLKSVQGLVVASQIPEFSYHKILFILPGQTREKNAEMSYYVSIRLPCILVSPAVSACVCSLLGGLWQISLNCSQPKLPDSFAV